MRPSDAKEYILAVCNPETPEGEASSKMHNTITFLRVSGEVSHQSGQMYRIHFWFSYNEFRSENFENSS